MRKNTSPFASHVLVHTHKYLALGLLLCVISLVGATQLHYATSYRAFLESDNLHLQQLDQIEELYNAGNDNIVILLKTHKGNFLESNWLQQLHDISLQLQQWNYLDKIDLITNYNIIRAINDEILIAPLFEYFNDTESESDKQMIRDNLLNDPFVIGRLLNDDATVTAIIVEFNIPQSEHSAAVINFGDTSQQIKQQLESQYQHLDVYLSGTLLFDYAMLEILIQDMIISFPIIILLVLILCYLFLGSLLPLIPVAAVIGITCISVAGFAGITGQDINTVSSLAFIVVAVLAVADSIHLIANYVLLLNKGASKEDAMRGSIDLNIKPMGITSFTTAIGFLSLLFSESPPFHSLGMLVAYGVLIAFLVTVFIVPWIVLKLNIPAKGLIAESSETFLRLGEQVMKHRRKILFIFVPVAIFISGFIGINQLNDDSLKWFDTDTEFRQSVEFASEHISGIRTLTFSFDTGQPYGINKTTFLNAIENFSRWLNAQPEVGHVYSFTDVYKRLNMTFHNNDPDWNILPESSQLAAQYLLTYQMGAASANKNSLISDNQQQMRVVVSLRNLPNKQYIGFEARCYQWMQTNIPELAVRGASVPIMFAMVGQSNLEQMLFGGLLTLVLITITLVFAFKSLSLGIISILPNVLPITVAYGCWGIVYGELNMAASIMFSVSIGLVVDDSVHLLSKYLKAVKNNIPSEDAIKYALGTAGPAIIITSCILAFSFSVFLMSDFLINASLGLMLAITVLIAMLFDLFCLPVCLYYLHKLFGMPKTDLSYKADAELLNGQ
ncbi:MAG: hypothetical protein CSA49_07730 [Gammaproteobacteria bacterium]|nr:MAG: hypothetical protein CSA49_07730 [Gammaproteobacteria bacterium]